MTKKKNDETRDLYNEDLIWMSYRYAIGLKPESEDDYFNVDFNSEEYHALVAEFREFLKKKKIKNVSDLLIKKKTDDLIYLSYHYALGRHTYASLHSGEIAQQAYKTLTNGRKKFMAKDIRKEIFDRLSWSSVKFCTNDYYIKDNFCPIDLFMSFIKDNGINSLNKLRGYSRIEAYVDSNLQIQYNTTWSEETVEKNQHFYPTMGFEDLFCWADLASCLDYSCHKFCKTSFEGEERIIEYFDSWVRDYPNDRADFVNPEDILMYKKIKRPVDSYLGNPNLTSYICEDFIVEDNLIFPDNLDEFEND